MVVSLVPSLRSRRVGDGRHVPYPLPRRRDRSPRCSKTPALVTIGATHHRRSGTPFGAPPSSRDGCSQDAAFSLERLLCDPEMGSSRRALCRRRSCARWTKAGRLLPEEHDRRMLFHFGCSVLPNIARVVILRTGIRARRASSPRSDSFAPSSPVNSGVPGEGRRPVRTELVGVRDGELVRAAIVGPTLGHTEACFEHIVGTMRASPCSPRCS